MSFLHRPATLKEVLQTRHELPEALVLAGGAGLMKHLHKRAEPPHDVIDLSGVQELHGIEVGRFGTWLGAMTVLHALTDDPLVRKHYPSLAEACALGPPQVRARVSIGGAVVGPRFQVIPALMALGARVEVRGHETPKRRDRIQDYYREESGPGELVVAVHLPPRGEGEHAFFRRVQGGAGDVVIAGRLRLVDGEVREAALVVGTSEHPGLHVKEVEEAMVSAPLSPRHLSGMAASFQAQDPQGKLSEYARAVSTRVLRSWLEHLS